MYFLFTQLNQSITFNTKERLGVAYNAALASFYQHVQQHRELENTFLTQHTNDKTKLNELEATIMEDIQKIDRVDREFGQTLTSTEKWSAIKEKWNKLRQNSSHFDKDTSLAEHEKLITDINGLFAEIGDKSNLILDPDLDTYYLMDSFIFGLPSLMESASKAKIQVMDIAPGAEITDEKKIELISLRDSIRNNLGRLEYAVKAMTEHNPGIGPKIKEAFDPLAKSTKNYANLIDTGIIHAKINRINRNQFVNVADNTIGLTAKLYDLETVTLDTLIQKRIDKYSQIKTQSIIAAIVFLTLALYGFIAFYFSVKQAVRTLQRNAVKLANGDLTAYVEINTKDELAMIANSFNTIAGSFRDIIERNKMIIGKLSFNTDKLLTNAQQTTDSTIYVATMMKEVSQGMEQQMNGANESAKSMEEISEGIQRVTEFSSFVSNESLENLDKSEKGNKHVQNLVYQMNLISKTVGNVAKLINTLGERSEDIEKIVEVITEIADQTNLLALNAAIEAARAGEHGKGFSIVAEEVRKLAEQSSQSGKQISSLIEEIQKETRHAVKAMSEGAREVQVGMNAVTDAGEAFNQILSSTKEISAQIQDMSAEIQQISCGAEEVAATFEEMSSLAESSAASSKNVAKSVEKQSKAMQEIFTNVQEINKIAQELEAYIGKFIV